MSESDWATSIYPAAMLGFLRDRGAVNHRRLRLFPVACCRLVWPLLDDATSRRAVEVAEAVADGYAAERELDGFARGRHFEAAALSNTLSSAVASAGWAAASPFGVHEAGLCSGYALDTAYVAALEGTGGGEAGGDERTVDAVMAAARRAQCDALRDLVGSPFRPVSFHPEWRTEAVVALARGIYAGRAWARMPVLADALEDAGGDDPDVLGHCRVPNAHVRACWVVDGLLGRT